MAAGTGDGLGERVSGRCHVLLQSGPRVEALPIDLVHGQPCAPCILIFDWYSSLSDLLGLADGALVGLGESAVQLVLVEVRGFGIARIGLDHSLSPHHGLLLPLSVLVPPERLQLHRLLVGRSLGRRRVGERVRAPGPAVHALLAIKGVVLVSGQQVWDFGAAVSVLVVAQSREIGLVGDCGRDVIGPCGGWPTLNGKPRRLIGLLLRRVYAIEKDAEVLHAVGTLSLAIKTLEGPGKVQLLLAASSSVILGDEGAVVELDVAYERGEVDKVLVAAGAVDILLLSVVLSGCQFWKEG